MEPLYGDDFYQDRAADTLPSYEIIVSKLIEWLHPKSVVDVGCGIGAALSLFQKKGVPVVLGIEGPWIKRNYLLIAEKDLLIQDLSQPFQISQKFDLALSIEVAEHLPENAADHFVEHLTKLAPVIVFAAAIPGQGGIGHVNEQWPEYWCGKFERQGFEKVDCLREIFWLIPEVKFCSKQNLFLYRKKGSTPQITASANHSLLSQAVHRDLYEEILRGFTSALEGSIRRFSVEQLTQEMIRRTKKKITRK
ncbi:MAG: hypothetical protein EXS63_06915 [Candidatus Omnitrophica bacterium]|nr:hypothetical protein [Candidatus Omnitrophota bacterium]